MSITPSPNLALYITPPNKPTINFADFLAYSGGRNQISVSQNFGRQGDTASINLVDGNYSYGTPPNMVVSPTFTIPAYSQVKLIDLNALAHYGSDDQASIFVGYVSDPMLYINSPNEAEWSLSCVDYTGYANASIVQGLYEGIPMGDAVVDIVKKANCGIKAALVTQGGHVEIGPNLPRTIIHYTNLTNALQKISKMSSSQSAYGWYVDSELNLHFYDQQQATSSGVTVTDTPTAAGYFSFTEAHIDQSQGFQYEFDGTSLYNRALVVGASKTITTSLKKAPTQTFTADGSQTSFKLSHVPDTAVRNTTTTTKTTLPAVTVNGIGQTVSVYDGTTPVTDQWTIEQNDDGSWSLKVTPNHGTIPSAGSKVSVWYRYKITITAQADLKQSQVSIGGPNHGIFSTVVNQTSIDSTAAAYQRATRELAEYGHPQERIKFTTTPEFVGIWRAGQTFILDSQFLLDSQNGFTPGLKAKFMITQQTCTVAQGGYRQWQVTAVRVE